MLKCFFFSSPGPGDDVSLYILVAMRYMLYNVDTVIAESSASFVLQSRNSGGR